MTTGCKDIQVRNDRLNVMIHRIFIDISMNFFVITHEIQESNKWGGGGQKKLQRGGGPKNHEKIT